MLPVSLQNPLWKKILLATPLLGIIPSSLFDSTLKAEINRARSSGLSDKVVHLLTLRNENLTTAGIRDLVSCAFLVSLLATGYIAKPTPRLLAALLSIYLATTSIHKDNLVEYNQKAIFELKRGKTPLLP